MKMRYSRLVLLVAIFAMGAAIFWPVEQGEHCYQTSDDTVRAFVKHDFLQRMTRWEYDAQLLGTTTPEIAWEKIDRASSENESEEVLLVPFYAKGPDAGRRYFGMYVCQQGYVEYAME